MKTKFILGFLVAILVVAFTATFASALSFELPGPYVEVNSLPASGNVAVVAGQTYSVSVEFTADAGEDATDVEVSAWIQGERSDRVDREFIDIIGEGQYKARLSVFIPEDTGPEEVLTLYVRIESDQGNWEEPYTLNAQRAANQLDLLLVEMDNTAKVGSTVVLNVVVKNTGRHEAEDTMVTVRIPDLGISKTTYFKDLAPTDSCGDSGDCDDEIDSYERRIFLTISEGTQPGTYTVEVIAYTDETETTAEKTLVVTDTLTEASVLSNPSSKKFSVGQEVAYDLLLVNTGNKIAVFNLAPQESDALAISLSDSLVTVPAGSSKVVKVYVSANREGTFGFAIDVNSDEFNSSARYSATVEGKSILGSGGAGNNLVALTIVLAIIFIVLVVILAVLLTRKPETSEEFGESYY